jgi:hypothetical protein
MNTHEPNNDDPKFDQAIAARLARLRTMPVDTSRLEKALSRKIPKPSPVWAHRLLQIGPLRALAATLAILSILGAVFFMTSSRPALASAEQLAQIHQEMVSGKTPVMHVDSIAAANRTLAEKSPESPQLPTVPADHIMACCMTNVKDKKVACLLLKDGGIPVTMTVARAADMRMPTSPTQIRNGITYHVQAVGRLNMVMTERQGRWVCLIGETPADQLMTLGAQLQF